jgi:hypothetical protein
MKKLVILLGLAMAAYGQQPPTNISKVVELRNIEFRGLDSFLSQFGVNVRQSPDSHFIVITGMKENVTAAEEALTRIDRPRRNIEVTFQILAGSTQPNNDKLPGELAAVVKQLRGSFVYQGFRLVETMQMRVRENTGANASSAMTPPTSGAPNGFFHAKFRAASLSGDEKAPKVRLEGLQFGARMPTPSAATFFSSGTDKVQTPTQWQFVESGIETDIDIPEGKTAVVGRANLDGKEGAFFLVVTAKVIE